MIGRIQDHLEAIYGITCQARAETFVVDTEAAVLLGSTGRSEEELLVAEGEGEGELEMALYLAPSLLARLKHYEGAPVGNVLDGDLDGYCQLAEGVSHFLYVAHTAAHGRALSLLELEVQAEVDKFAVCLLHRWGEGVGAWAEELLERLFQRVSYRERLSPGSTCPLGSAHKGRPWGRMTATSQVPALSRMTTPPADASRGMPAHPT